MAECPRQWVLAVETGGSGIHVRLVPRFPSPEPDSGSPRYEAHGPPGNLSTLGIDTLGDRLLEVVLPLLDRARADPGSVRLVLATAGFVPENPPSLLSSRLTGYGFETPILLTDIQAAYAGTGAIPGDICLIAGTGSVALGRREDGSWVQRGGWGPILGDEGSGYDLGHRALVHLAHHLDGRGTGSTLIERLLDQLNLPAEAAVSGRIRDMAGHPHEIARLAPTVLAAAREGIEPASTWVNSACRDLVDLVMTLLDTMGTTRRNSTIFFYGGLLLGDGWYRDRLTALLLQSRNENRSPREEKDGIQTKIAPVDSGLRGATRIGQETPWA